MTGFIATIAATKGTPLRTPPSAASSASASASPSPSATVTTSASASKSKATSAATASFTPFTARSTIYRRHEARLHRSMEQQGDRRPAMIRVLSLLPGFRTIVPPYDDIHDRHGQAHAGTGTGTETGTTTGRTTNDALALTSPRPSTSTSTSQTPQLGDYSEETIFSTAAMSSPSSMSVAEPRKHVQQHSSSSPSSLPGRMAAQASLATGMAAGAVEFLLRPYATTTATMTGSVASAAAIPFNPFQKVSTSTTAFGANSSAHTTTGRATLAFSAAAGGGGEASILAASATPVVMPSPWNTTIATRSMAATTMTSSRALLATTTATSALFGTKVYLEQHFQEEKPSSSSSSPLTMTSVATSSMAGIVSGMIQHQTLMMSTGSQGGGRLIMGTKLVGQHMVAATFYFGVYEALRPTTSTAAPPSLTGIAVAGGLAGVVHTSLLNTMRIGAGVRLLPLLMRAAPTHALLFCSYESMRYHCHYR